MILDDRPVIDQITAPPDAVTILDVVHEMMRDRILAREPSVVEYFTAKLLALHPVTDDADLDRVTRMAETLVGYATDARLALVDEFADEMEARL